MDYEVVGTRVLIIGAGAAGLRAAIELAERGVECLVVGKRPHGDAHTTKAAGGINASLGSLDDDDDWTLHAADTLREGHFICDPAAVELLARRAPERVRELAQWGCPFSRTEEGALNQRYFGAQSYRRTCFVGDRTGAAILETLVKRAGELDVAWRENVYITKIVADGAEVSGALGWDMVHGGGVAFEASAVLLAAGGCTQLYRRSSSRPGENTGDAMGLAYSAGAVLRDMEFIQFHPTGMAWPQDWEGELVTEAVRGEGGRLVNAEGERFMERYAPEEMELAARDVVARAIAKEIEEGRGTERGGVYLDISHRDKDFICERLPGLYERYTGLGVDISKEAMEVAPTAHYAMGGVKVDFETGATNIGGFFAAGEATSGLHGANRLGGNSLAETVVFGQLTGAHIAQWVQGRRGVSLSEAEAKKHFKELDKRCRQHGSQSPRDVITDLGALLERYAGIVRSGDGLAQGGEELDELRRRAEDLQVFTRPGTSVFEEVCNLEFMLDVAQMILEAAQMRQESRGAHFREDLPREEEVWKASIICRRGDDGELELSKEEIGAASQEVREAVERDVHLDYHHLE